MRTKILLNIILGTLMYSSCHKKEILPTISNTCGDEKSIIKIENNIYCGIGSECAPSMNYKSPCNKGGNGEKLTFWYFYNDVTIQKYKFKTIYFLCVAENVIGKGTYNLKVIENEYDASRFMSFDTNKTLNLKNGIIEVIMLTKEKINANFKLTILYEDKEKIINGSLTNISLK